MRAFCCIVFAMCLSCNHLQHVHAHAAVPWGLHFADVVRVSSRSARDYGLLLHSKAARCKMQCMQLPPECQQAQDYVAVQSCARNLLLCICRFVAVHTLALLLPSLQCVRHVRFAPSMHSFKALDTVQTASKLCLL
jgi:hypothetical protein